MLIPLRGNFRTLRVTNFSAVIPFCCFFFYLVTLGVLLFWCFCNDTNLSIVRNSWCYMGHSFNRSVESRYYFTSFLHIVWSIRLGYYETSFYWTFTRNMPKISHSDRSHFPWCSITWDWSCWLRFKCAYDKSHLILPLLRTNPLALPSTGGNLNHVRMLDYNSLPRFPRTFLSISWPPYVD